MLCCLDASVANDDYADRRKKSRRPKKQNTFEEVELRMPGTYGHMNGRIPANAEGSVHSNQTDGTVTPFEGDEQGEVQGDVQDEVQGQNEVEMEDDTLSERDLLQHQLQQLQRERDDYRNRLSWYASSNLKDANPNIVDLSDPNRPDALGQRMVELYDNQWTDAYIYLTDNGMEEKAALGILVDMLRTVYRVCKTLAAQQMNSLGSQIGFFTGFDQVPPYFLPTVQMYKDERKKNFKKFLPLLEKKARKYVKTVRGLGDYFFLEALETCWLLCIQDPPMVLDFACFPGDVFDSKSFRPFTNPGSHVDFLVWPALRLYDNGPMLTKGFAQGRRGGIQTHHEVTRRLTSDTRPEHGSTYRRRDNSHLSKISESSLEYQTFMSSQPSQYSKSYSSDRSSSRYMPLSDSQSQRSRSDTLRIQKRREKDFGEFLKNADFKTAEEIDAEARNDQSDAKEPERFVIPGRDKTYNTEEDAKEPAGALSQENTLKNSTLIPDNTLDSERTFIDEETQTSDKDVQSPIKSPDKTFHSPAHSEPSLNQSPSFSIPSRGKPDGHDISKDAPGVVDERQNSTNDVIPQHVEANEDEMNPKHEEISLDESKSPDAFWDTVHGETTDKTDINANIIVKPLLPVHKQNDALPVDTSPSTSPSKDKTTLVGILKNGASRSPAFSPSDSTDTASKRGASRQSNRRPIKRSTPTRSVASLDSNASKKDRNSNKENKPLSPMNEDVTRNTKSPIQYLTVKVNKIKRIPRRIYADDSLNSANEQNKDVYRAVSGIDRQGHNINSEYTPRNVPSVESSGVRSLSTIVLSRNTLRQSTENTPRLTTRTVTPVQGYRHPKQRTAFENNSRMSTDQGRHTPSNEQFMESRERVSSNLRGESQGRIESHEQGKRYGRPDSHGRAETYGRAVSHERGERYERDESYVRVESHTRSRSHGRAESHGRVEGHGHSTGDDSRFSDRGYVSRAITDYTPRNRNMRHTPPVVKQYPAIRPDFSNTIQLMPDSSLMLTPKPPPKIPGSVAAKLRFATH